MSRPFRVLPTLALSVTLLAFMACGDTTGTAPPEPEGPGPATVAVSPEKATLATIGEGLQYEATVWDGEGRVIPGAPVTWYTSDENVVTISESGLATAVGDGTATILAAASDAVFGWGEVTVTAKPMRIVTSVLRPGVLGVPYQQTLAAEGVLQPTWSVSDGSLPDGLALEPTFGTISGTPTVVGEFFFEVTLSDGDQTLSRDLSIAVIIQELGFDFQEDEFSLIPAGSFQMGSEDGYIMEKPVHTATITRPFLMQKTEVTQLQWTTIMGGNPSGWARCGDLCPVENVSWIEIQSNSSWRS